MMTPEEKKNIPIPEGDATKNGNVNANGNGNGNANANAGGTGTTTTTTTGTDNKLKSVQAPAPFAPKDLVKPVAKPPVVNPGAPLLDENQVQDEAIKAMKNEYTSAGVDPYVVEYEKLNEEPEAEKAARLAKEKHYDDIIAELDAMSARRRKDLESEEDRLKREKQDRMWAGIGDGISSLANLYFTTQYSPDAYDGNNTMSKAAQDRYDKIRANRDNIEKLIQGLSAEKQKALADKYAAMLANRQGRQAAIKAAQQMKLAADNQKSLAQLRANGGYYKGNTYNLNQDKWDHQKDKDAQEQARKDRQFEEQQRHNRAMESKPTGSGSQPKPVGYIDGVPYYNNNDYEVAARAYGEANGVDTKDWMGNPLKGNQIVSDVEAKRSSTGGNAGASGTGSASARGASARGTNAKGQTSTGVGWKSRKKK